VKRFLGRITGSYGKMIY